MNCTDTNTSILVIGNDTIEHAELRETLGNCGLDIRSADSLTAAMEIVNRIRVSIVVCDRELMECNDFSRSEAYFFLESSIPVIFFSASQIAAVKFQSYREHSFYCLKISACRDLFPVIQNLAALQKNAAFQSTNGQSRRPYLGLPIDVPDAVPLSNIHSLY